MSKTCRHSRWCSVEPSRLFRGGGGSVWNSSNRDLAGWLASENDGLTVYELLTGGTASQYWVGGEKSLWPMAGTILTTIRYRNRMEQMQTLAQQNDRRLTGVSVGFWSDTSGRPVVMYSVWKNCMHDGQLKVCVVTFNLTKIIIKNITNSYAFGKALRFEFENIGIGPQYILMICYKLMPITVSKVRQFIRSYQPVG